jgi:hypothetical protein
MTLKDGQGQKALVARVKSSKTEIDTLSMHIRPQTARPYDCGSHFVFFSVVLSLATTADGFTYLFSPMFLPQSHMMLPTLRRSLRPTNPSKLNKIIVLEAKEKLSKVLLFSSFHLST